MPGHDGLRVSLGDECSTATLTPRRPEVGANASRGFWLVGFTFPSSHRLFPAKHPARTRGANAIGATTLSSTVPRHLAPALIRLQCSEKFHFSAHRASPESLRLKSIEMVI